MRWVGWLAAGAGVSDAGGSSSASEANGKPDAKADAKPDAKADAKPDAKADAKPDAKADAKPDAKAPAPARTNDAPKEYRAVENETPATIAKRYFPPIVSSALVIVL
jgi:hypothetical protein